MIRSVYSVREEAPYYYEYCIEVPRVNPGENKETKLERFHEAFNHIVSDKKVMEFSSRSAEKSVKKLMPGKLTKVVGDEKVPVKGLFESAEKVCAEIPDGGGMVMTAMNKSGKKNEEKKSSKVVGYRYNGHVFGNRPRQLFYNYLYINALLDHPDEVGTLMEFDSFSDIQNSSDGVNPVPAQAAAIYVSLARLGLLERVKDPEEFEALFKVG